MLPARTQVPRPCLVLQGCPPSHNQPPAKRRCCHTAQGLRHIGGGGARGDGSEKQSELRKGTRHPPSDQQLGICFSGEKESRGWRPGLRVRQESRGQSEVSPGAPHPEGLPGKYHPLLKAPGGNRVGQGGGTFRQLGPGPRVQVCGLAAQGGGRGRGEGTK